MIGDEPGNTNEDPNASEEAVPIATMLIDIYMDGFSLHWRSAPLRRTVNHRVGLSIRVPKRIGSATIQLTGGQPGLNRLRVVSQDYHCIDSRGVAKHERPHERRQ